MSCSSLSRSASRNCSLMAQALSATELACCSCWATSAFACVVCASVAFRSSSPCSSTAISANTTASEENMPSTMVIDSPSSLVERGSSRPGRRPRTYSEGSHPPRGQREHRPDQHGRADQATRSAGTFAWVDRPRRDMVSQRSYVSSTRPAPSSAREDFPRAGCYRLPRERSRPGVRGEPPGCQDRRSRSIGRIKGVLSRP